jgi:hypothetical protein
VPNPDPEEPDIIEISPDIVDAARNVLISRISRQRRPVMAVSLAILAAIAAIAAIGVFAAVSPTAPASSASPVLAKLIKEVTSAPERMPDSMYFGYVSALTQPVRGTPLTQGGKPEVLYVDAGYCPYCAAESWALIVALSYFGTFSGLSTVRTHHYHRIAPIDGWTFYGSSFSSRYLAFVPVETSSDTLVTAKANPDDVTSYRKLQKLTPAEQAVFDKYDTALSVPFLDFGNRSVEIGSTLDPSALAGQTWSQIASTLRAGRTPAARAILGAAGSLTAQICELTGDRPANACPPGISSIHAAAVSSQAPRANGGPRTRQLPGRARCFGAPRPRLT